MTNHSKEQIYVAELKLPSCFYTSSKRRQEIPNPDGFEISKGYYIVRSPDEQTAVEAHPEIILVIKFVGTNLKDAEDHAFKVGELFGSLASAYGGYPLGEPRLHRMASIGVDERIKSQHNYLYGHKPYMLLNFDQTVEYQFRQYLESVSSIAGKTKHQLQSAIHWYGLSISVDDPTVSYVAAWTGLESIGKAIDGIAHPNGPKVHCQICGNKAGENRDRKMAGIDHAFNIFAQSLSFRSLPEESRQLLSKELVEGFSYSQAQCLRNSIVHGLQEVEVLLKECTKCRRHLFHVLNISIQIALGRFATSWITGDYEFHPIERASIKCTEKANKSPYYGEWIEGLEFQAEPGIHVGGRFCVARFKLEWELDANLIEATSMEGFRRDTDVFGPDGSEILDFAKWNDRPVEPPWEKASIPDGKRNSRRT